MPNKKHNQSASWTGMRTEIAAATDPAPIRNALHQSRFRKPGRPLYERFLPHLGFGILRGLRRAMKRGSPASRR